MRPLHPLFLLGAVPQWLDANSTVEAIGEREFSFTLDIGATMFRAGRVSPELRWVTAHVRTDDTGRLTVLSHAFKNGREGNRFNRWETTELLEFGCAPPERPAGLGD
jgi:hypothetical protein